MRPWVLLILAGLLGSSAIAADDEAIDAAKMRTYEAIDLHPLMDGMSHWRKRYGRDPRTLREDFCGTAVMACALTRMRRRSSVIDSPFVFRQSSIP